jgi:hypothetical protein
MRPNWNPQFSSRRPSSSETLLGFSPRCRNLRCSDKKESNILKESKDRTKFFVCGAERGDLLLRFLYLFLVLGKHPLFYNYLFNHSLSCLSPSIPPWRQGEEMLCDLCEHLNTILSITDPGKDTTLKRRKNLVSKRGR